MLVLGRKVNETITISDNIRITVLCINGNRVRLGIEAPKNLTVIREELLGLGDFGPDGWRTDRPTLAGWQGDRRRATPRLIAQKSLVAGSGLRLPRFPCARPVRVVPQELTPSGLPRTASQKSLRRELI